MKTNIRYFRGETFLRVMRGYLQLHTLIKEGQGESENADLIRDDLDTPWYALTDEEQKVLRGLAEDLFLIRQNETMTVKAPINVATAQKDLLQVVEAKNNGEWEFALTTLRRYASFFPKELIAYMLGEIWNKAGFAEVALLFYEHAVHLDPNNKTYKILYLGVLQQIDPQESLNKAEAILASADSHSADVVIKAASIALHSTHANHRVGLRNSLRLAEIILAKLDNSQEEKTLSSVLLGLLLLAQIFESNGQVKEAYDCYSKGLRIDSSNDAFLTGRGILTYGIDPMATNDFERAIQFHSQLIWPYFFLAHHYILNNRYEECQKICEKAILLNSSNTIKSLLFEWLAISQSELGFSHQMIRANFEESIRLNPNNQFALQNFERFEAILKHQTTTQTWQKQLARIVRDLGNTEKRIQFAA